MVKKKRVQRKASKKVMSKKVNSTKPKSKIEFTLNKFLFFVMISLVSFVLYRFVNGDGLEFLNNLFFMGAMIFGFVSVGFLIALIVLIVINSFPKKSSIKKKRRK